MDCRPSACPEILTDPCVQVNVWSFNRTRAFGSLTGPCVTSLGSFSTPECGLECGEVITDRNLSVPTSLGIRPSCFIGTKMTCLHQNLYNFSTVDPNNLKQLLDET